MLPVGLSAWRSFVFRSSISMICTPDSTVIQASLECTWYLSIIVFFYALIISLPYHCNIRFLFSLTAGDLRVSGFFVPDGTVSCHYDDLWCRWWRRGCGLDDLLFRCSISMISAQFHCDTSLQCACCVVKLLYHARIISLQYIIIELFFFSHWKQRVVALTALSTLVAPWVVSTTNCGVTADGVVYRLDDRPLVSVLV